MNNLPGCTSLQGFALTQAHSGFAEQGSKSTSCKQLTQLQLGQERLRETERERGIGVESRVSGEGQQPGRKQDTPRAFFFFQGKYMDIEFDYKGDPVGGLISNCKWLYLISLINKHLHIHMLLRTMYTLHAPQDLLEKVTTYMQMKSIFTHMPCSISKSRVVSQSEGERNFHIFYQLLVGASVDVLRKSQLLHNSISNVTAICC